MATQPVKLDQEELQVLIQLQQVTQNIVVEYGNIEMIRKNLEVRSQNTDDALKSLREKELELANSLQEKYGQGSINLQDGTFLPTPVEEVQDEEESTEEVSAE
jgi:hypothetical protein